MEYRSHRSETTEPESRVGTTTTKAQQKKEMI